MNRLDCALNLLARTVQKGSQGSGQNGCCPREPATGCAVTTKEISGIVPDAAGPEESRATSWMAWLQTWLVVVSQMIYFAYALLLYNMWPNRLRSRSVPGVTPFV